MPYIHEVHKNINPLRTVAAYMRQYVKDHGRIYASIDFSSSKRPSLRDLIAGSVIIISNYYFLMRLAVA